GTQPRRARGRARPGRAPRGRTRTRDPRAASRTLPSVSDPTGGLGGFIRMQRELAQLSLRQLADGAKVSNAYLSQVERGVYRPSAQVLKGIADALHLSVETLYARAGLLDEDP